MKTARDTFTAWSREAIAAGFDGGQDEGRRAVMTRPFEKRACVPDKGKVIDLNAWRAANLDEVQAEPDWAEGDQPAAAPAPRPRRSRKAMLTAELVSTLSVVAAAVALIVRVLTF